MGGGKENSERHRNLRLHESLSLHCSYNLKSFINKPFALLAHLTVPPSTSPFPLLHPFSPLTLNPYTITYVFEFEQNLPGQLNALLIHMFDGDNISLMAGVKGEKGN